MVQIYGFSLETPRTCKEGEERGAELRGEDLGRPGKEPGLGFQSQGPREVDGGIPESRLQTLGCK